jgi:hypothetical protein
MNMRLGHQYLLTFQAKPETKAGTEPVKVSSEIRGVDLFGQTRVCVPGAQTR